MTPENPNLPILVIDDDAMVRSILIEYLEHMGFKNIYAAKNGEDAIRRVMDRTYPIGLIISDWEMPEISGLSILKSVRNNQDRSDTPFIMVTSQRSMERFKISQAAQWQVSAYILKPFRQEQLRKKIWEVLGWADARSA
jgi:two-component system chemotaxis response regulator CheY